MIDFSTHTLRPREQRDAWGDQLAAMCGRQASLRFGDDDFAASIRMHDVGGISIGRLSHNAREIAHDKRPKMEAQCGHMMLILQLSGRTVIAQGGTETEIGARELAIIDTRRPFVSRFGGATHQLAAYIPAAELTACHAASAFARPRRWGGLAGVAGLTRSTLLFIARSAERLEHDDADCARQSLIGLVHHLIDQDRVGRIPPAAPVQPDHRVRSFIDAHLADPDLTPARIAAACGISLRRLHRAFADTPWSVCGWVRHRRLEQCRRTLLDPMHDRLTITQIAFRWGFNDAAHFSRSFRDAYNQSPRDVRRRPGS